MNSIMDEGLHAAWEGHVSVQAKSLCVKICWNEAACTILRSWNGTGSAIKSGWFNLSSSTSRLIMAFPIQEALLKTMDG